MHIDESKKRISNHLVEPPKKRHKKCRNHVLIKDYSKYEFQGNLIDDKSPFKIMNQSSFTFGNDKVHTDMTIDEIVNKLGNDIDVDWLLEQHNTYYENYSVQQISIQDLDSTLLINMMLQSVCQKCGYQSTNIWCRLCGIWSHIHCETDVGPDALNFICPKCE